MRNVLQNLKHIIISNTSRARRMWMGLGANSLQSFTGDDFSLAHYSYVREKGIIPRVGFVNY